MIGGYWKLVARRALKDTVRTLHLDSPVRIILAVLTAAVVLGALLFLGSGDAAADELIVRSAIAGIVVLAFVGTFMVSFIRAPANIDAEHEAIIQSFREKETTQAHVDKLSSFLDIGIRKIWNSEVNTEQELDELESFDEQWRSDITAHLRAHFPYSEVIHFTRLGVVPTITRGGTYGDDIGRHRNILMFYAEREKRLRDIIGRHTKKSGFYH